MPEPWASTRAKWTTTAGRRPRRKPLPVARPIAQILQDAEQLVTAWKRQANRMPMLFSPTIGAAITARYWFLWLRCPACRITGDVDMRTLDWHPGAAITALIPALACR